MGSAFEQIPAMKPQREIGILQRVPSQYQHNPFIRLNEALLDQLLQSREGDGGSRFAADALRTDLGFGGGNLDFAYLFDRAAGLANHPQSFLPGRRVADPNCRGHGVGMHRNQLLSSGLSYRAHQGIRTLGLDDRNLGYSRDKTQLF